MASPADAKLLEAAYYGNVPAIKGALRNGANPNCLDAGQGLQTPLSYAAASGNADAVAELLKSGADITQSIFAFFTAEGDDEILGLLVRANPEFAFREFDELDFVKGTEYEKERRTLQRYGHTPQSIDSNDELQRIASEIRFAKKIKGIARQLRGGRRSRSRSRSRQKSTYRRRTFKR
jgi:ankyrin repeat protein